MRFGTIRPSAPIPPASGATPAAQRPSWLFHARDGPQRISAASATKGIAAASAEAAKEERPLYHFDADFSQESLGEAIERYLTEKGQNSVKVAIGWQDLESGEEYYFHPDYFYAGASFYKLPLAMAHADKVAEGELSLDDKVGPYVLRDALEMILVNSNNPAGRALRDHLVPDEPAFKRLIVPYSGIAEENLPRGYFCGNQ